MEFRFRAELWMHTGQGAWPFVTLPTDVADDVDDRVGPDRRGFGSVRVRATIGATRWSTSIFPDKAAGSFVLPVKKPVRQSEGVEDGDVVDVTLEIVEGD